jgi:hypothetical protein
MVPTLGRLGVLAGVATITLAPAALGQAFRCTAETAGQLSIQGIVQCECRPFLESRLAGTPAGSRWDCGILQARMNQEVPATANPYPFPLPPALLLDRDKLRHHKFQD